MYFLASFVCFKPPYAALTNFTDLGLAPTIVRALDANEITQPTEIQEKSIPTLLTGEQDFIGLAQTGTGKTAAFGLPLLQHINVRQRDVQGLVLAPTRELGQQIAHQLELFSKHLTRLNIEAVYGGVALGPQIRRVKNRPHILVATPGRLIDLVERGVVDLGQVSHLVLDEADEMLNMGFQPAIDQILSFLPSEKAIWLFSATMPEAIKRLVHRYMRQGYAQVKVSPQNVVNRNIEHQYVVCSAEDKREVLQLLLSQDTTKRGIIFCRTKATAKNLAHRLSTQGVHVDALHGDLPQSKREGVMKKFKALRLQALVATDVAARGIDVKDLHFVYHYNLPEQLEYYTHRSGRTARAGKQGTSLCLVAPHEVRRVRHIARTLGLQFRELPAPHRGNLDKRRLMEWVQKVMDTPPSARATPALLRAAEEAFEGVTKQALIAKLVAHALG